MLWIQTVFTVTHRQAGDRGEHSACSHGERVDGMPPNGGARTPGALVGVQRTGKAQPGTHAQQVRALAPHPRVWGDPRKVPSLQSSQVPTPGRDPKGPHRPTVPMEWGGAAAGGCRACRWARLIAPGRDSICTPDKNHPAAVVHSSGEPGLPLARVVAAPKD